mgnify:CR=1 FL=1
MRLRSQARECALQVLYQIEIGNVAVDDAVRDYFEGRSFSDQVKMFTAFLARGVTQHRDRLNEYIRQYARNWELERMAVIDKNILRIGIYEILYVEDIPPKVSINEAVELAKRFGDTDSPKFVNGILDSVYRKEKPMSEQVASPN